MYNVITVWVSEQKGKIGTFSTWIYDQAASICWLDFWTSGIWDWKKREVKSNDYKRWWFCCQWISVSEMFGSADALEVGLLSLILKSLIKSLMQKSDIGAYIRIVKAAADVLAG